MTILGTVSKGYGKASQNLSDYHELIEKRTGLLNLVKGTLNVKIREPYYVKPDACITSHEYKYNEAIYFQRCKINGLKALIMRPDTHEAGQHHGPCYLEIMCYLNLRDQFSLKDGDEVQVEITDPDDWW